jgi:hypothetical protein
MAIAKLSISFDAEVAEEAKRHAGPKGLSRLVNAAVRQHLQAIRLREAEIELTEKYGPITEEAKQRVAAFEWPK